MLLLSKYPIDTENIRTFQTFLWKDMPDSLLPTIALPDADNSWYSPEEQEVLRLSSKSHWDVPILVDGEVIHVLASHPTPPVFDGAEDRNGKRNHDEIRFWADYITPGQGDYIYDDRGNTGGLASGSRFVIMGDQNADPFDGDSFDFAIRQLLGNPFVNTSLAPSSEGGVEASERQGRINAEHIGNPTFDTADFADPPGNLRVDYVLPSKNLQIQDAQVFWPTSDDPLFPLVGDFDPSLPGGFPSSDHRLIWADLTVAMDQIPVVPFAAETPAIIDDEDADAVLLGDADDPAIWANPNHSDDSLIITALKDGGLATFNLDGSLNQSLPANPYGSVRYNNVDLVYGFEMGDTSVDLAIATDRQNDTLTIWAIDPETRQLVSITAPELSIPDASIFGIDDGSQTAYGIATYTSPISGKTYVFASQREGNQIAQLELIANVDGTVTAETVRTLTAPIPPGLELEDAQFEGMVVDRELGFLYAGQEERGIWKFQAEPDAPTEGKLIEAVQPEGEVLAADVEGLTLYYGANGTGYLLASSQGDSTYAVFSREGNNDYLGSFAVGDGLDNVEESDGADVINVALGDRFPKGLFVVHDGSNQPAVLAEDDGELENISTNFKLVAWENVANAFPMPLAIDPASFDPRHPGAFSLVNGVASGDTTQDSTVLWTRSTSLGDVNFAYGTDALFSDVLGTVTATVTDPMQPVKVSLTDLEPGTTYFYRATDAAGAIATGQFTTSQPVGNQTGLRFGFTGDWQQAPPYPSLANVADRNLEFFLKLGDTIYADTETPALPGVSQARTLSDFRTKQEEVVSTRFGLNTVRDLYASTSVLVTIDDHELVDNFAGGAAPGDSPDAPDIGSSDEPLFVDDVPFVNETQAYQDALQAFQEYHPIQEKFYGETGDPRTAGKRQLYRYNTYGSDAAMFVLDTRSFRDAQLALADLANPTEFLLNTFNPDRTLLGSQQLHDLKRDLLDAQENGITWKFVAVPEPIQNFGLVNAEDRFEGYAAERTELLKFIDDNNISNVVFLAADFHGTIVNNLTYQEAPGQPQIPTSAFEIVSGPAAFFEGLFGRAVVEIATQAGLLTPEERAFYDTLPVAPDADDLLNDKDDFVKQILSSQTELLGYDPVGLNNNLPEADGLINATLLQGDYVNVHTYSWTEFDIAPDTQKLTVTTYGISDYSEADLLANPGDIISRMPAIVSQFEVSPTL